MEHQLLPLPANLPVVQHTHAVVPTLTAAALHPLLLVRVRVQTRRQILLLDQHFVAQKLLLQQLVAILTPYMLEGLVNVILLVQLDHFPALATAMQRLALQQIVPAVTQRTQTLLLLVVLLVETQVLLLQFRKLTHIILLHTPRILRNNLILHVKKSSHFHLVVLVAIRKQQAHVLMERRHALVLAACVLLLHRLQIDRLLDDLVVLLTTLR